MHLNNLSRNVSSNNAQLFLLRILNSLLIVFFIIVIYRDGEKIVLLGPDWSQVQYGKSAATNDFIVARCTWSTDQNKFVYLVNHFLSANEKSPGVAYNCLKSLIYTIQQEQEVDTVYISSDGGPSDFKCSWFQESMQHLSSVLDVPIEHIILAPHHGWSVADGAKATAQARIKSYMLSNRKATLTVAEMIEQVNLTKTYNCGEAPTDKPFRKPKSRDRLTGIASCWHLSHSPGRDIYGYAYSDDPMPEIKERWK